MTVPVALTPPTTFVGEKVTEVGTDWAMIGAKRKKNAEKTSRLRRFMVCVGAIPSRRCSGQFYGKVAGVLALSAKRDRKSAIGRISKEMRPIDLAKRARRGYRVTVSVAVWLVDPVRDAVIVTVV